MSGMLLLLLGLALAGAAMGWWIRHRAPRPVSTRPAPAGEDGDALPGGDAENGLAAFYAYQMAASRIKRASAG